MSDYARREALLALARLVTYGDDDGEEFERILSGLAESPTPALFRDLCQAVMEQVDLNEGVITCREIRGGDEIRSPFPELAATQAVEGAVEDAVDALLTPTLRLPLNGHAPHYRPVDDVPTGGVL